MNTANPMASLEVELMETLVRSIFCTGHYVLPNGFSGSRTNGNSCGLVTSQGAQCPMASLEVELMETPALSVEPRTSVSQWLLWKSN